MYLTGIHVFFPDPWPKARHHKRRLIQKQFVQQNCNKVPRSAVPAPGHGLAGLRPADDRSRRRPPPRWNGLPGPPVPRFPQPAGERPCHPRSRTAAAALGHPIADIVAVRGAPKGRNMPLRRFNTAASPGPQSPPPPGLQAVDQAMQKALRPADRLLVICRCRDNGRFRAGTASSGRSWLPAQGILYRSDAKNSRTILQCQSRKGTRGMLDPHSAIFVITDSPYPARPDSSAGI